MTEFERRPFLELFPPPSYPAPPPPLTNEELQVLSSCIAVPVTIIQGDCEELVLLSAITITIQNLRTLLKPHIADKNPNDFFLVLQQPNCEGIFMK
jgi:hypothetical protein